MLAEGIADVATIDRICRMEGAFRMGPFELMDLVGVDVGFEISKSFFEQSFGEPTAGARRRSPRATSPPACTDARPSAATTHTASGTGADGAPGHRPPDPIRARRSGRARARA